MTITLGPRTQQLLEQQMKKGHFSDPEEVLCLALQSLEETKAEDYEELDEQTRAAIEEAEAECQRGEALPWEQVREELRARFIDRK